MLRSHRTPAWIRCQIAQLGEMRRTNVSGMPITQAMRKPRHVVTSEPHEVELTSVAMRTLFSYPSDYLRFLRVLAESMERNRCQLHAFSLVSRCAYLLIAPRAPLDLSNCMQVTCQRYALIRNRLTKRSGALFARRFESTYIERADLEKTRRRIESHPVVAGKAESPEAYRWSSANIRLAAALRVA